MTAPRYVAIITDGNGRWAQQRDLPVAAGHQAGADVVKARLRDAVELGVEELTVFSFSTENWTRPSEEVEGLMRMMGERIANETPELDAEGVRMRFVGRREGVPPQLVELMEWAEEKTAANDRIVFFVAFNYGGRAEIVDAARSFQGGSEEEFRNHLYAPEMHDPDLLIRTSGERRISNYLLWQCAYSELVFRDELWPDFDRAAFEDSPARVRDPPAPLRSALMRTDLFDDEMFEDEPPPPPKPPRQPRKKRGLRRRDREAGAGGAALDRLRDRDRRRRRHRLRGGDDRRSASSACASTSP